MFRRPEGESRRRITMPAELVDAMRLQRTAQAVERERAGSAWQDLDLVFAQPAGSPIDPRPDWADRQELTSAAGVRNVRVHDVRHTAGTLLVAQGVHIRAVQEIAMKVAAMLEPLDGLRVTAYERDVLSRVGSWETDTIAVLAALLRRARQARHG